MKTDYSLNIMTLIQNTVRLIYRKKVHSLTDSSLTYGNETCIDQLFLFSLKNLYPLNSSIKLSK